MMQELKPKIKQRSVYTPNDLNFGVVMFPRFNMRSVYRKCTVLTFLLSLLTSFGGCSRTITACDQFYQNRNSQSVMTCPSLKNKDVIVFIPGYKGSALRNRNSKERIWITPKEEIFGRRSLNLSPRFPGDVVEELEPDGVLRSVRVIPGVWEVDVYQGWLNVLEDIVPRDTAIVEFPYDWRQDNHLSVLQLDRLLKQIRDSGAKRIIPIAHSMGGLILSYYLRFGTQDFEVNLEDWSGLNMVDNAVLIGTPFRGVSYVFRNMQIGSVNMVNKELLEFSTISTFPAAFQLMPRPDEMMLLDTKGRSIQNLVYDANNWERFNWGPFQKPKHERAVDSELTARVSEYLNRAKMFLDKLNSPLSNHPHKIVPTLLARGTGTPTFNHLVFDEQTKEVILDEKQLKKLSNRISVDTLFKPGDGVVTESSSIPPLAFETIIQEKLEIRELHDALGKDEELKKSLKQFLSKQLTN